MFGKLTLDAFKHDMIELGAGVGMAFGVLFVIAYLTYHKRWTWLWKEWITSVDPKKIGIMYFTIVILMVVKGVIDAVMMRAQLMFAVGEAGGYLGAAHYQQIFTAHGVTMIFFVGMGSIFAIMNLLVPLQIGARDVAFPFLNAVSFWLFLAGGLLMIVSLVIGNYSAAGWIGYPPLSGIKYSPDVGVDYWIWSVQVAGVGSLLSGINFLVTIIKMRCPGMTFKNMPMLIWAIMGTLILIIFAFPILTATLAMLTLDRLLDMHFFTAELGGSPMMYINLIWAWGHPEVYILVLPAFGVFSEVVAAYSKKALFGYMSMVWSIVTIAFLSFIVWLHHFFTMGAGGTVNAFFGIMTMLIAVPTGVKIFNWIFTMYRGRVDLKTPMIWFLGFVLVFTTGGLTGMLLSIAPADFQLHNGLFLIAHFHSMVIGGVLFGVFAAFTYWFPKFTGFTLDEKYGRYACYCWIGGFLVAFMPLYALGLMGATRRLNYYDASTGWQPLFVVAGIGAALISLGIFFQILQVVKSVKDHDFKQKGVKDPWDGRTLEWSTTSPPPVYNFAILPEVSERDAFWHEKQSTEPKKKPVYESFLLPHNTSIAFFIGVLSFLIGFALTWAILWMAILSTLGIVALMVIRLANQETEYEVSVSEIQQIENTL
ncbi:MAG: cbb3-type cytochrome c oxidase subunit I [Rhabdochlamydiaceae bacterium]|nr:cbb3-type cytochrome c oxidase subunit I [Rhabdochlamydiaceae bacterium]